ncbi:MAG: leucyl aminopeptidase [Chloroflexales bacterium]|nr:leucyl aminopeptidase [Chloroflexales bacterium]
MEITTRRGEILREATPLAVLCVWEDEQLPPEVAALVETDDFRGWFKQLLVLYPCGALPARRLLLVGLGKRSKATADTVRQAAALAAQKAHELRLTHFAASLPVNEALTPEVSAQAWAEGAELGLYRYLLYKSAPEPEQKHRVEQLLMLVEDDVKMVNTGLKLGQMVARGVALGRDLANGPGNSITPTHLGEVAQEIGARLGMQVTVLGLEELQSQGFGGILAVGQGSAQPPRFIVMEYGQAQKGRPTICLVGKGITFDTGGISIKPAEKMDNMKMDMGGAAAVLGTMHIVAELGLPLHVIGLISAAENMPSATAYKPGDIIKTLSGQTVEVLNTDAEGRIVLADALYYAQRYQPHAIIDLATLTGAVMVALGPHAIGMMGNDQALVDRLTRAGEAAAERVWQLPLWDEYREMMKSEIADLKNTGGRYGGAITAAGFLAAFVADYPWVHLDIAGTAWIEQPTRSYVTKGATGVGIRLLTQMLRDFATVEVQ